MTTTEILVIAFGLFLGYWIVSKLIGGSPSSRTPTPKPDTQAESAVDRSDERPSVVDWHRVLEVDRTASVEQIRTAYKTLIGQYHPDKVAHLGEELRHVADRRSKEIDAAYHAALRERGYE